MIGAVPEEVVAKLWRACLSNSFELVQRAAKECVNKGFPVDQVLAQVR